MSLGTSSTAPERSPPPSGREFRYRDLFDAIDQGFCLVEVLFDDSNRPLDYRFLEVNASFEAQTGLIDATGRTMRSLRPDHEQHWFDIYGRVALTGESIRFENRAAALGRWYDVYAFRIGRPERKTVAILFKDITDRKRDQERLALLSEEIGHRAQNLLTVVMSIAHVTRADSISEYRTKLIGRLDALARSQRLLSAHKDEAAELDMLVAEELAGHVAPTDRRATWHGPTVFLKSDTAQCVAMALHELATNATKYGALSASGGRIDIAWVWQDDRRLSVRWSESGGPAVTAPVREGTGSRVIMRCIRDQLNGEVTFDWRPTGLVCELTVPTSARAASASEAP